MEEALQLPETVKEQRNQDLLGLINSIAYEGYGQSLPPTHMAATESS